MRDTIGCMSRSGSRQHRQVASRLARAARTRRAVVAVVALVVSFVSTEADGVAAAAPTPVPTETVTRDRAHARTWAAVDAVGDALAPRATTPAPIVPRVPAASTVSAGCPATSNGLGSASPGPGQLVVNRSDGDGDYFYAVIGTGSWIESPDHPYDCPAFYETFGINCDTVTVELGPGTLVMWQIPGQPMHFELGTFSFSGFCNGYPGNGAVLQYGDALKLLNACPGCNLSGVDLANLEFAAGTDLTGANLSGATITNVGMTKAILENTIVDGATISGSSFTDTEVRARFDGTVFRDVTFPSSGLPCSSFKDTVLLEVSFAETSWDSPPCPTPTFDGAVLAMDTLPLGEWENVTFASSTIVVDAATRTSARGLSLDAWSFVDSQFVGLPPDLSGMTVAKATLDGSSFVLADLTGATFTAPTSMQRTVFVDAVLDQVKLPGAVAHGAVFTGASLEGAVFDGAQLGRGPNPDSPLPTATFRTADAHGASFANVEARGVQFDEAYLYPGDAVVSFDGAQLEGATFTGAVLGATDLTNIDAPSIRFDGAQCINCDFTGARMASATFDSSYLYGADFKGATMQSASFLNAACCGTGTWSYSLGAGAAAAPQPYAPDPVSPTMNGPEFDDIDLCPSGVPPSSPGGCQGRTAPQQPPLQPRCAAAADHDCALDIVLLAGDGTAGYSDGGPQADARLASFNLPADVAYDPVTGDAIVADTANRVVRRIASVSSTAPTVSIVAGSVPAPASPTPVGAPPKRTRPRPGAVSGLPTLIAPTGVAVSGSTIAIADATSSIVFTTPGTGTPRPLAGTGTVCPAPTDACGDGAPAARAELNRPEGIWYDPNGNLYLADTGNNRVRRVDATDGTITTVVGTGASGYTGDDGAARAAQLARPTDVVGDRLGNLYVADAGNAAIRRVDPEGIITTLAGGDGSLTNPVALTVDGRNRIFVSDAGTNTVSTVNLFGVAVPSAGTGTPGYTGDGGPARLAELNGPVGLGAVGDDALFVADTANSRIRIIGPAP